MTLFEPGHKKAKGGKRAGAGRPLSEKTRLKRIALENANGNAEDALAYCIQLSLDETEPASLRLAASSEVMDRVWGKPSQAIKHSGEIGGQGKAREEILAIVGAFLAEELSKQSKNENPKS